MSKGLTTLNQVFLKLIFLPLRALSIMVIQSAQAIRVNEIIAGLPQWVF